MRIEHGDMREVLGKMVAEGKTVQSVVTDPPYGLAFMGKKWDASANVAFMPGTWRLCWELLPPGGHLVAFAGTRTYHRMAVAIEEAGFEIRDQLAWLYGSGFPKSRNVSKAIDSEAGAEREVVGGLHEWGKVGGFEICKVCCRLRANAEGSPCRGPSPIREPEGSSRQWEGWGTALKPAMELICLARKPLVNTVAGNVLKHGTGALNIDGCRVESEPQTPRGMATGLASRKYFSDGAAPEIDKQPHAAGRWPANVAHDGSDEVVSAFPDQTSGGTPPSRPQHSNSYGGGFYGQENPQGIGSTSGNASRFFYSAKADADDRLGSKHPTVKPVDLMRWLVRLITPPGGTVLDPFAGSGTTGMACMAEGIDCILVEREAEYVADIKRRLAHVRGDDTPLFRETSQEVLL